MNNITNDILFDTKNAVGNETGCIMKDDLRIFLCDTIWSPVDDNALDIIIQTQLDFL